MSSKQKRPLKVFLCHASGDKPVARDLYQRLKKDGADPWLDKENLLPGQNWVAEINNAVREADAIIVCLSEKSVNKEGFVQKEIKMALDIAEEKLEETIYIIPARVEEVDVPNRLSRWQWVDLFDDDGYHRLMKSLKLRAKKLGVRIGETTQDSTTFEKELQQLYNDGLEAYHTEKWDRSIYYFQAFLAERPDHASAQKKIEISRENRKLEKFYEDAVNAQNKESWQISIQGFEKILSEISDYKDSATRLEEVRLKYRIAELYADAEQLYEAEAWEGVIGVFKKIKKLTLEFSDVKNLLENAQKEFATVEEQEKIESLYAQALTNMDIEKWEKAQKLLKKVQQKSPSFRETEALLIKIEKEIKKGKVISVADSNGVTGEEGILLIYWILVGIMVFIAAIFMFLPLGIN